MLTKLTTLTLGLGLAACGSHVYGSYSGSRSYDPSTPDVPSTSTYAPSSECVDPSGFGGRGCYRCEPTTNEELLNACTTSQFEAFDNTERIDGYSEATPKPALPVQGPTPPPFGETTTTEPDPNAPPAPACALDGVANPIMVLGATGFPMETIAKAMGASATVFYLEKSSCDGVAAMVLGQKMIGEVVVYDATGAKNRCILQEEHPADITLSALFPASCANQSGLAEPVVLPSQVDDLVGPINPVMFASPATSKERAISAEAAYRVYGMGHLSGVTPWDDETLIFRRRPGSGNQLTVAASLGLPIDALRGRDSNGSSNMLKALYESAAPQKTIGISSAEIVDVNRDVMKTLAYRHYEQPVAFYPDSDAATLDRRNVRDGHYFLWMPLHVLTRTRGGDPIAADDATLDSDGTRKSARDTSVKLLAYVMTSRQRAPVPSVDLFGALKRHARRGRPGHRGRARGGSDSRAGPCGPKGCRCANSPRLSRSWAGTWAGMQSPQSTRRARASTAHSRPRPQAGGGTPALRRRAHCPPFAFATSRAGAGAGRSASRMPLAP